MGINCTSCVRPFSSFAPASLNLEATKAGEACEGDTTGDEMDVADKKMELGAFSLSILDVMNHRDPLP